MTDKSVIDTIIAEAGGNEGGMRAVAAVIANRAAKTGLTPAQVVQQSGQFAGYSNPGHGSREAQKIGRIRDMAERAFTDISTGKVADPTNGSTSFRTAGTHIDAPHGTVNIGGNVFAKGNGALAAINAAAPSPQSRPSALAYAPSPASMPELPRPRPADTFNLAPPNLPLNAPIAQGTGRYWGNNTDHWGPGFTATAQQLPPAFLGSATGGVPAGAAGNGSSALMPQLPRPRPSAPLTSHSVQTVHIGNDGNPISDLQFALNNYAANRADPSNPANAPKVASVPKASTPLTGSYVQGPMRASDGLRQKVQLPTVPAPTNAFAGSNAGVSASGPVRVASNPTPAQRNANDIVVSRPLPPVATPPRTIDATNPLDIYRMGLTTSPTPAPQTPAQQAITHQIVNPAYTAWKASQTAPLHAGQAYTAGGSVVKQGEQNAFGGLSSYLVPPPKVSAPAPPQYLTVQLPTVPQAVDPWASVRYGVPAVPTPGMVTGPITQPGAAPHPGGLLGILGGLFGGGNAAPKAPGFNGKTSITSNELAGANQGFGGTNALMPDSTNSSRWLTGY